MVAFADGCSRSSPPAHAPDSHAQMLETLEDVRLDTPFVHPYLGTARRDEGEQRLASLPTQGFESERFSLHCVLSHQNLALGNGDATVAHLNSALSLLPFLDGKVPPEMESLLTLQLAVAYLRQGETENCVDCNGRESCIIPIQAGGIHEHQTGSRKAIEHLLAVLQLQPDNSTAMWLLNVAYMTIGGYPDDVPQLFLIPPKRFDGPADFPRFHNIAKELDLDTFSLAGGAIAEDFDGDGLLDVMVSTWDTNESLRLFRNDGKGGFTDCSDAAGLTGIYGGLNIMQADYDNDGDYDVLVLRGAWLNDLGTRHPNSLLQNDGRGKFTDVTFAAGLGDRHYPTQTASWADYDNDGDLDLFVGNEQFPCQLFENSGGGQFKDVARQAGVQNEASATASTWGFTKGVTWGDYDGDRYPDIYVSNHGQPNRLYRNNGNKTFSDVAAQLGVQKPLKSFPTWFWDYNNDGNLDIYASAYWYQAQYFAADYLGHSHDAEKDHLYQGDGKGGFQEVAEQCRVAHVTLPMGSNFGDLNNDGYLDFYLGTGYPELEGLMPNRMYLSDRGKEFIDVTYAGGFGHLQKGHGVAFADFDNDGDQDVFIEMGGAYRVDGFANALFENPGFGNHWIRIHLIGRKSNRSAIGVRIKAVINEYGQRRSVYKWVGSGGSFGANSVSRQNIGLAGASSIEELEVYWPTSNRTQRFRNVAVDQAIEIVEGETEFRRIPERPIPFRL
jgi:FG-GAP-like repeat/ASPIC and UnbV